MEQRRTAVHGLVQKTDVRPSSDRQTGHIAVDETVIQRNDQRQWLYAAVDSETNVFLHVRLFQPRTAERTWLLLREPKRKVPVTQATFLVDDAHHLRGALDRLTDFRCVATEVEMLPNVFSER